MLANFHDRDTEIGGAEFVGSVLTQITKVDILRHKL
jgi:hypothetical protein